MAVFLGAIRDAWPEAVNFAAMEKHMPAITTRQLARFIDLLESRNLYLVEYGTKTRGPFRLSCSPQEVRIVGTPRSTVQTQTLPQNHHWLPSCEELTDKHWIDWVLAMQQAILALQDGNFDGEQGVFAALSHAGNCLGNLPRWCLGPVLAREAHALIRCSRHREASYCLRRASSEVRLGYAHPALAERIALTYAKMLFDSARLDRAELKLAEARAAHPPVSPAVLNMEALLSGKRIATASPADAKNRLTNTLKLLAEAFGHILLGNGDATQLDALSFNFGNNLWRGVEHRILGSEEADTAMRWLAANMFICKKQGIGDDSILVNLLIFDIGIRHGYQISNWPTVLRQVLNNASAPDALLADSLQRARRQGNRLEIAECRMRQAGRQAGSDDGRLAFIEARELFQELGRRDKLLELAALAGRSTEQ